MMRRRMEAVVGPDDVTLALVLPDRGASAMYFPSCLAAAELAAAELNAQDGVGGRRLRLQVVDPPNEHHDGIAELAREVHAGRVHAVTGVHPSFTRESVYDAIGGRVPYLFPSVWEGGARPRGLLCTGETPAVQAWPAVQWIGRHAGVRRWMVVGDDYVWPRGTARFLAERLRPHDAWLGAALVSYEDLESEDRRDVAIERLVSAVERSGADGVIMLFVGEHAALFNRAFSERGLDASILRFSTLMDENMLLASGPDATRGLLSAGTYANGVVTSSTDRLQQAYGLRYGDVAPTLNQFAVSLYDAVKMIAQLADPVTGRLGVEHLERTVQDGFSYAGPRGGLSVRGGMVQQDVFLYLANGCGFDLVAQLD